MSALPIPGPQAYSDEWFKLRVFDPERVGREVLFGASRAGNVIENPLEEFLYYTARKERPAANELMEVGLLMEPVVLEIHRRRTGYKLRTGLPMYFHGDKNRWFMAATPDAEACEEDAPEYVWGVDAKTTSDHMVLKEGLDMHKYGTEGTDNVPMHVLWQCVQQCDVMNYPYIDVPVLVGRRYKAYRVYPDSTLIETLVAAEKELAERIINDDPPPPTWSHPRTRECLQALYGMEKGLVHPLSDMNFSRWCSVARRKNEIKILEAANVADINQILAEMGPAEYAALPRESAYLKRIQVRDSLWTDADVELARTSLGTVKRAGHVRLQQVKNVKG
jgi:predicted phage-related endonuclease